MKRTVVLTGKAVVNFRKVIDNVDDDEVEELLESNDHRESQIDDDDLLDIEWICSGLMKPDTLLGENARQIEVSDDQTTPYLFR